MGTTRIFYMFLYIFNSYGTQAPWPITNKWIQLSVINTFDPIRFILWCLGIVVWGMGVSDIAFPTLNFGDY